MGRKASLWAVRYPIILAVGRGASGGPGTEAPRTIVHKGVGPRLAPDEGTKAVGGQDRARARRRTGHPHPHRLALPYHAVGLAPGSSRSITVGAAVPLLNWLQKNRELDIGQLQKERELEVEKQRAQDEALQAYLDQLTQLLVTQHDQHLVKLQVDEEVRRVIKARTESLLRSVNAHRKWSIVLFLAVMELLETEDPIVSLAGADLREVNGYGAPLEGIDLKEANLEGANLTGADLEGANFQGAFLGKANLQRANLVGTNLQETNLPRAEFQWADFSGAQLQRAHLREANLDYARFLQRQS
jgi:Pentapeptide repeats (8 copies)